MYVRVGEIIHSSFVLCVQIVTNGLLQSVEHRAVTNSGAPRLSVVTIMLPDMDCRIEPAPALVIEGEQAKFRPFLFREFNEAYAAAAANREDVLQWSDRPATCFAWFQPLTAPLNIS